MWSKAFASVVDLSHSIRCQLVPRHWSHFHMSVLTTNRQTPGLVRLITEWDAERVECGILLISSRSDDMATCASCVLAEYKLNTERTALAMESQKKDTSTHALPVILAASSYPAISLFVTPDHCRPLQRAHRHRYIDPRTVLLVKVTEEICKPMQLPIVLRLHGIH